ncbi:MAG: ABC-F family ATP-binding cassette domain-containing protein [Chloroflexi bacterium]|nr:ABC-F family ATP-binding cassette domain-containing protein [Chloroflexota bacterium]
MLRVDNIKKAYGGQVVLDGVSFHLSPGDILGLIGVNGSGKSTFLKIISSIIEPDSGNVYIAPGASVAYLPQEIELKTGGSLYKEMEALFLDVAVLEERLRRIEDEMETACAGSLDALLSEYGFIREKYEHYEPEAMEANILKVLFGLGFNKDDLDKKVSLFSGGWQTRIALAKILLRYPSVLLLDEPTNHLDIPSLEWLESFLSGHKGAMIVVSHDRYFLDRLTGRIGEMENSRLNLFTGNYSSYLEQKSGRIEVQKRHYDDRQKFLEKNQKFIDRFRAKATKASAVKSREKMLEKMEKIEAPSPDLKSINFSFNLEEGSRRDVLYFKNLRKDYPGRTINFKGEFKLERGDRVALVGPNGVGKSTLLKIFAGVEIYDGGRFELDSWARTSYFSQLQSETMNMENTPVDEIYRSLKSGISIEAIRTRLGSFLITGDAALKKIGKLSGGEKSRVALALLTLKPVNLLLLDEPTNHLDISSREVLAEAVEKFDGTVVMISHDRYFLDRTVNKVFELDGESISQYLGNYSEYFEKKKKERKAAPKAAPVPEKKKRKQKQQKHKKAAPPKGPDYKKLMHEIEEMIEDKEFELKVIEEELADTSLYLDLEKQKDAGERHDRVRSEIMELNRKWEEYYQQAEKG